MKHQPSTQRGFAAIAAVFLVVMLAALGAFMVSVSNTQQLSSAQDVQGSRAYWAARAGLEWAIASQGAGTTTCFGGATPPTTLQGFTLTVSCAPSSFTEGASLVYIFRHTSVASIGTMGGIGFVERSVTASVKR